MTNYGIVAPSPHTSRRGRQLDVVLHVAVAVKRPLRVVVPGAHACRGAIVGPAGGNLSDAEVGNLDLLGPIDQWIRQLDVVVNAAVHPQLEE